MPTFIWLLFISVGFGMAIFTIGVRVGRTVEREEQAQEEVRVWEAFQRVADKRLGQ